MGKLEARSKSLQRLVPSCIDNNNRSYNVYIAIYDIHIHTYALTHTLYHAYNIILIKQHPFRSCPKFNV